MTMGCGMGARAWPGAPAYHGAHSCAWRWQPSSAAPAPPTVLTQAGRKTLKLDMQPFAHAGLRLVLDAWTARTGLAIELVGGPPTDEEVIARYTPAFRAGASPADGSASATAPAPTAPAGCAPACSRMSNNTKFG